MGLRRLILGALLLACGLVARASDALPSPNGGASPTVTQPHERAELIPEKTLVQAGEPFDVILHLHSDPGWHTYWINPGDAGLATIIKWTLPPGFTAGPIQWPTPEIHKMGPLTTYGYAGDVYLLTTITTPKDVGKNVVDASIQADARWLVCKEECIPGEAKLAMKVQVAGEGPATDYIYQDNHALFAAAKSRLPVANTVVKIEASYGPQSGFSGQSGPPALNLGLAGGDGVFSEAAKGLRFFPEQENVLSNDEKAQGQAFVSSNGKDLGWSISLQQNGEKPDHLSGVMVADQPFQAGGAKAIYLSRFPVKSGAAANTEASPAPGGVTSLGGATPAAQASDGHRPPLQRGTAARRSAATTEAEPWLVAVLGGAFLGGLILNLMPCVLPVLSLKVFSLVRHAGDDPRGAWKQGAAFTVGVVISFWILAGLLIALRAAGNHLGWGFQMQSPGFVLALIFLFFLLGLNLFGVFELGTSLVGLDARASGHAGSGLTSSLLNGALATLAATPCTAPFMGSSVGFAAEQPAWVALLIFTVLALGMATPYLLLTIFPGALRFVPKPGAWMEAFRQFMGFLLMATVIFLAYVFGALVGQDQVPYLLMALLVAGLGVWIYGRWGTAIHSSGARFAAMVLALLAVGGALFWGSDLARATPPKLSLAAQADGWQPWTPAAVAAAQAQGRSVFVDFTAAWCLSCKVNERVALETDAVRGAFAQKKVALFRADWTQPDPAISDVLQQYHRDGVPLYLYYAAGAGAPQVLPEVLTPGIVLDALSK